MLKQWRIALILVVAMAISVFVSACGSSSGGTASSTPTTAATSSSGGVTCVSGSLTASGSTALAPLVKLVAQDYQKKCSGATITVNLGGSKTGLSQAEAGSVQIGNSDIFASKSQSDLVDHQVAVVIFAVIVNNKLGISKLTTDQIKSIYSGKTTNWKDVGGPDQKIVVVSRPASSGTRATFQTYVLGGPESISGPASLTTDSTGTVIQNVAQNPGAIGYASTGPAKQNSGVTMVSIDGYAPTADLVKNNTYKFWNIEHMYTKGPASGLADAFIKYMTSADAKSEAAKLDFVAITDMSQNALSAHQPKS